MVRYSPSIDDILGIEQTKLGFFQEWQRKLSELHAAHAESEQQRILNATLLESITDLMMVLDTNMCIVSVNKVFEELFPHSSPIGKPCFHFFCNTHVPCPACPAFTALREEKVCRSTAIFQIKERNLHFDMVASLVPSPVGQEKRVLMLKRDVTLQKQLQAQIYQAEKMASLGILAAGVAHEINNPLTAIGGFAEGILRRIPTLQQSAPLELSQDIAEYTHIILRENNRCRDIVQALMNLSRPLPSLRPVCLAALVKETLSLLRYTLKQHHRVVFCLDIAEHLASVWADDTQLRQVLLNLITNALDALACGSAGEGSEGTVTIRITENPTHVILQVEDTGTGILPSHMPTVFEPFFTTKPKGLGLGLSLCYNVIKAHGGEITLQSTPGATTQATIHMPKSPPSEQVDIRPTTAGA